MRESGRELEQRWFPNRLLFHKEIPACLPVENNCLEASTKNRIVIQIRLISR